MSRHVMMGIGQVGTLRVPAELTAARGEPRHQAAWSGHRTGFDATYDCKKVGEEAHAKALAQ